MPHDRLDLSRLGESRPVRTTATINLSQAEMARLLARGRRLRTEAMHQAFGAAYAAVTGRLRRPVVEPGHGGRRATC